MRGKAKRLSRCDLQKDRSTTEDTEDTEVPTSRKEREKRGTRIEVNRRGHGGKYWMTSQKPHPVAKIRDKGGAP